jgi:biotin-dependent carboxylase-like uncharacterized protein
VIEVVRPGPLATVQDLGRPGLGDLGVGRSGAADRPSLRLANRLVGNRESAAGIEATLGGLVVRFESTALVGLAGAPCPLRVDDRAVDMYAPVAIRAGQTLRLGVPPIGLRTYLAVRGGIDVPPVLGSRSTDTLAGLGPDRLSPGTRLPIGADHVGHPVVDHAPQRSYTDPVVLHVIPGPRDDWFVDGAIQALCSGAYTVTRDCDRVGMRLHGPVLARQITDELKPEATVLGAVQVPPSGQPILFLADHPVTGGYPVIAVVSDDDLHLAAQARPGHRLMFRVQQAAGAGAAQRAAASHTAPAG